MSLICLLNSDSLMFWELKEFNKSDAKKANNTTKTFKKLNSIIIFNKLHTPK